MCKLVCCSGYWSFKFVLFLKIMFKLFTQKASGIDDVHAKGKCVQIVFKPFRKTNSCVMRFMYRDFNRPAQLWEVTCAMGVCNNSSCNTHTRKRACSFPTGSTPALLLFSMGRVLCTGSSNFFILNSARARARHKRNRYYQRAYECYVRAPTLSTMRCVVVQLFFNPKRSAQHRACHMRTSVRVVFVGCACMLINCTAATFSTQARSVRLTTSSV